MIITEEMIRKVQARVDVSYEDAEKYLRRAKGNVDRAVLLAKSNSESSWDHFKDDVRNFFGNLFQYKLLVFRKSRTLINLPIVLVLFFFMIIEGSLWNRIFLMFVAFLIALIAECEIRIEKDTKSEKKGEARTETGKTETKNTEKEKTEKKKTEVANANSEKEKQSSQPKANKTEIVEVVIEEGYNDNEEDCYEIIIEE